MVNRGNAQLPTPDSQRRAGVRAAAVVLAILAAMVWARPATPSAQAPSAAQGAATAPATPPAQAAASAPPGRVDAGAAVYRKVGCYQCHVNQAQGGANGPRLGPNPIPFARFAQYVRKPTGEMPPYTEKVLPAQDLADIYAFLQARPRPPALNTIPQLAP